MKLSVLTGLVCVLAGIGISCNRSSTEKQNAGAGAGSAKAVVDLEPTKGNQAKGTVTFTQESDGKVRVVADITGLRPNSEHGFHIHQNAECGEDGMKAGGHWNPEKKNHGGPTAAEHHAGDLGNVKADANGKAHLDITIEGVSVNGPKDPVVGHSVVLHADPDDLKTQPTGNSGSRIACGPIKLAK